MHLGYSQNCNVPQQFWRHTVAHNLLSIHAHQQRGNIDTLVARASRLLGFTVAIVPRHVDGSHCSHITMQASNSHAQLLLSFPHPMLKNLFGGKKKEGFFLDLSDGQSAPAPEAASSEAPAPEPPAPEPIPEPAPVAAAPAPVAAVVASTPAEAPAVEAPAVAPVEAPAAAPVREPVSVNFATTYLQPSGQGAPRRRPSANMGGFLDMARNVRG